jgi:hypothetical protein
MGHRQFEIFPIDDFAGIKRRFIPEQELVV